MIARTITTAAAAGVLLALAAVPAAAVGAITVPPHDTRVEVGTCSQVLPDLGEYARGHSDFEVTGVSGPISATGEEEQLTNSYITVCAEGEGEGTVDYSIVRDRRTLTGTLSITTYAIGHAVGEPIIVTASADGEFYHVLPYPGELCELGDNVWSWEDGSGRLSDPGKGGTITCSDRYSTDTLVIETHAQGEARAAEEEAQVAAEEQAECEKVERELEAAQDATEAPADVETPEPAPENAEPNTDLTEAAPEGDDSGVPVVPLSIAGGFLLVGALGWLITNRRTKTAKESRD